MIFTILTDVCKNVNSNHIHNISMKEKREKRITVFGKAVHGGLCDNLYQKKYIFTKLQYCTLSQNPFLHNFVTSTTKEE